MDVAERDTGAGVLSAATPAPSAQLIGDTLPSREAVGVEAQRRARVVEVGLELEVAGVDGSVLDGKKEKTTRGGL